MRGDFDECEALIRRAGEIRRLTSIYGADATVVAQLVDLRREQGRLAELRRLLAGLDAGSLPVATYVAYAHVGAGDIAAARDVVARAGGVDLPPDDWRWCAEAAVAATVACAVADLDAIDALYDAKAPLRGTLASSGTIECAGPADLYLGRLAHARGDAATAEAHLRDSLALAVAIGSPPWEAQSALSLSAVVADRTEAGELASRSLAIADRIGTQQVAREARARAAGG